MDKICIAAVAVTLVLTILFQFGEPLGLQIASRTVKYESTLFDTSYVHSIDIVMDDWDSFIETCEDEEYTSCTVVVDGEKHSNIAIRAKGNTSLSNVSSLGSSRYSFKLEFDHYEDGKSLDGLDKLCLNNLIQDNTMMKDYIVYALMRDFGVDTPLCSFAYLTVNGEDWGLYLAVEGVEDSFLERNYGSETGELYKPDSMSFGGGRGNGKDFNMDDFDFEGLGTDSADTDTDTGTSAQPQTDTQTQSDTADGFVMPSGGDFSGFTPGDMDTDDFDPGTLFGEDFDPSDGTMTMPSGGDFGDFQPGQMTENGADGDGTRTQPGGEMQSGGGMGSEDVKLQYIDDDPDSYSNIFDNAKTDVSSADEERLIASLKSLSEYENLEDILDTDEVLRYFVVHNFVCNADSYTGSMVHNYYLRECDGELSMIPWDYNLAFGTFQGGDAADTVNTSIDSPVSGGSVDDRPMVGWIFSDESYTEEYHTLFAEFVERWFTNGELENTITETAELIRPYVEKDPTKFCTTEEFEAGVTALREFVALRGQAVQQQLDGNTTQVDTGSLNLSDMGTMGSTMGGGNMPAMPTGGMGDRTAEESTGETDGSAETADAAAEGGKEASPPSDPDGSGGENAVSFPDASGDAEAAGGMGTMDGGERPAMPGNGMSGGSQNGGGRPSVPGENTGAQQSAGTAESGTEETAAEESPSEEAAGTEQTVTSEQDPGNTDTAQENRTVPSDGMQQAPDSGSSGNRESLPEGQSTASDGNVWLWVGASVLVLAAGLWITIRRK